MSINRSWMYKRLADRGLLNEDFKEGVNEFLQTALNLYPSGVIACPCRKCKNKKSLTWDIVREHLFEKGFIENYYVWGAHGETSNSNGLVYLDGASSSRDNTSELPYDPYKAMFEDAVRNEFPPSTQDGMHTNDDPTPMAESIHEMLEMTSQPCFDGCPMTELSAMTEILNLKTEMDLSEAATDRIIQLVNRFFPTHIPNRPIQNFKKIKRKLSLLGMKHQSIDCCPNGCMIYWKADNELMECKFCSSARYMINNQSNTSIPLSRMEYFPITPRLQRLYASETTAEKMRWHKDHHTEQGVMRHPSDAKAWSHFDNLYPYFAQDPRNVRLGLCTDGFQPFGQFGQKYSCWPIIVTPYNLPPGTCMKRQFLFLSVLVPGPKNPAKRIDVYLQPLIEELKELWEVGAITYDALSKEYFNMRAILLWTVSDFPAYAMLSGWSTKGKFACPYCTEFTEAFWLRHSRKHSWFDSHRKFLAGDHPFRLDTQNFTKGKAIMYGPPLQRDGSYCYGEMDALMLVTELGGIEHNKVAGKDIGWKKRSIFWDLPYWKDLLLRHNLDVMHIEKNFFENIFYTIMGVPGKSKDHTRGRMDMEHTCHRPSMARDRQGKYPKAPFILSIKQKEALCDWVDSLKFPDGYASRLGRCVEMEHLKLFGMKSHDCHIFMQRLLPVAFREMLPTGIWEAITEISLFFRDLTRKTVRVTDIEKLKLDIPVILCKLEKIFPPSFFDPTEHLPIHLPDEVLLGGPPDYRWMYPFENFLGSVLKTKIGNKARVEASIREGYLLSEMGTFASYYFPEEVTTKARRVPRFDDGFMINDDATISIFAQKAKLIGAGTRRYMDQDESNAVHSYVLRNCPEIDPFREMFSNATGIIASDEVQFQAQFPIWFYHHVQTNNVSHPRWIRALSRFPSPYVTTYQTLHINGYKFNTVARSEERVTCNCGVMVKCTSHDGLRLDYYGLIHEIIQLDYQDYKVIVLKCEWFEPSDRGTRVHPLYDIVDVNIQYRLQTSDCYILASQADQVVYVSYPTAKTRTNKWLSVIHCLPRAFVEKVLAGSSTHVDEQPLAFQQNEPGNSFETGFDITIHQHMDDLLLCQRKTLLSIRLHLKDWGLVCRTTN
ncbi:unnamed protein product [Cuscuta epithymum]|uniref:Transposase-associated domain-containing protein n=1 Tax=Cuscuta epithymum TaxID=186058 RepID=A0AAV0FBP9_9ASTE|nr:unnamed protein product [Cuscuta epithymum]